jgi:hypothetical protein
MYVSRALGQHVIQLIKERRESEAITQLKANPAVAWCQDDLDPLGSYPVHLAVAVGMHDLLEELIALPGMEDRSSLMTGHLCHD